MKRAVHSPPHVVALIMLVFSLTPTALAAQDIRIASYNMERLGQGHKDYAALAQVVAGFDLVVAEEVMNRRGVTSLVRELPEGWSAFMSPVGEGPKSYREHFAFFFDRKVTTVRDLGEYPAGGELVRPPYGMRFRVESSGFEFNLIACHIIYGKRESQRVAEINKLGRVYRYFESLTGNRRDTIIAGDFNEERIQDFASLIDLGDREVVPLKGSTIGMRGPDHGYDHMFVSEPLVARVVSADVDYWTSDFEWSRRNVSDHFPVFVVLRASMK